MTYRFTIRSITPDDYRWVTGFFGGTPSSGDVRDGIDTGDGITGVLDIPPITEVVSGIIFDNYGATGIFVVPTISQVESGIIYGANSEYTGIVGICDYPNIGDVQSGGKLKYSYLPQLLLDSQEPVILTYPLGAGEGSCLYLSASSSHTQIGYKTIFCLSGAMGDNRLPANPVGHLNSLKCLCEGPYLIKFYQNSVCRTLFYTPGDSLRIGNKQIITYNLNLAS